jgi:DNA-binding CsgD family transcriptional regulator
MESTEAALTGALDSLGSGFILMNECGRILFMNRAAETMLQRQDGLRQRDNRLAANNRREEAALHACVSAAGRTTTGTGFSSGGVLRVTRPSGQAPYAVTIMPVSPRGHLLDKQKARVVALLTDPESIPIPGAILLRGLFAFTAAESEVAQLLMQGLDRKEIADHLSVSLNTVRTHLRNLFSKTATSSQAKLVRLLLVATRTVPDLTRRAP